MRPENVKMRAFLKQHGITCKAKYIRSGSLSGCWRLYGKGQNWEEPLISLIKGLGFIGFDGKQLDRASGNGGKFEIFVRGHNEFLEEGYNVGNHQRYYNHGESKKKRRNRRKNQRTVS